MPRCWQRSRPACRGVEARVYWRGSRGVEAVSCTNQHPLLHGPPCTEQHVGGAHYLIAFRSGGRTRGWSLPAIGCWLSWISTPDLCAACSRATRSARGRAWTLGRDILRCKIHGIHIWQLGRLKWLEVLSRRSCRVSECVSTLLLKHARAELRARPTAPQHGHRPKLRPVMDQTVDDTGSKTFIFSVEYPLPEPPPQ